MNTDGTLTINADGISYTTAVSQNISNIMANLISQATLALILFLRFLLLFLQHKQAKHQQKYPQQPYLHPILLD